MVFDRMRYLDAYFQFYFIQQAKAVQHFTEKINWFVLMGLCESGVTLLLVKALQFFLFLAYPSIYCNTVDN